MDECLGATSQFAVDIHVCPQPHDICIEGFKRIESKVISVLIVWGEMEAITIYMFCFIGFVAFLLLYVSCKFSQITFKVLAQKSW